MELDRSKSNWIEANRIEESYLLEAALEARLLEGAGERCASVEHGDRLLEEPRLGIKRSMLLPLSLGHRQRRLAPLSLRRSLRQRALRPRPRERHAAVTSRYPAVLLL